MIFKTHDDAARFGLGQQLLEAGVDPLEALVVGEAGESRLDPFVGHQFVESLAGPPAAGVDADRRDAEFVGHLQAALGVLDVLLSLVGVRSHEALVRREAHQVEAQ